MLYLSLADTEQLDLRMTDVVPAIEDAFRLVGEEKSVVVPRVRLLHPPLPPGASGYGRPWERDLRIIPGAIEGVGYGVRLGASLRRHAGAAGVVLALFDWDTMTLTALISDHLVHAVRSTAPDGVAARYLALEDADTLGLIGSGRLARWAAEAVCAVRPIKKVRVWSPNPAHRAECVNYLQGRASEGVEVLSAPDAEHAVRSSQIVVTATNAAAPVLEGRWLDPGMTVLSNTPEELDRETLRRADRIFTTYREGVLGHVPPYHSLVELIESGEATEASFATEIADLVVGRAQGRTDDGDLLVCLNPAYGVLDVATAKFVYDRAIHAGIGTELPA